MTTNITLRSLEIENFKGIKKLSFNFLRHNSTIRGENATGKTTIADSVNWALFGKDSQDRKEFEIKPLDENNNVIHGLESKVTIAFIVNDRRVNLTRILKEKWTKRRGEAERTFSGNETLYYVNDVPVKQSEYNATVSGLVNENLFKLITNPLFFSNNLKWTDRRKMLLEITGDITTEEVITSNPKLTPLYDLLNDMDVDSLKKSISAKRRKLNEELKSLPYRIDELNKSLVDEDFEGIEFQLRQHKGNLTSLDNKLSAIAAVGESKVVKLREINNLKLEQQHIKSELEMKAYEPLTNLKSKLSSVVSEFKVNTVKIENVKKTIESDKNHIASLESKKLALREKWYQENSKELIFEEGAFECPTCKRALEDDDIEDKKAKLTENFNIDKSKNLEKINEDGKEINFTIDKFTKIIENHSNELEALNSSVSELLEAKIILEKSIAEFIPTVNLESNEEYNQLESRIAALEVEVANSSTESTDNAELTEKKRALNQKIQECIKILAAKDSNVEFKARIAELTDREKYLAQEIATIEGQELLCEEFVKAKVELIEASVNNKFKFVKFKLFDTQVNGALVDTCEALVDGVPFGNANTAGQVNAGLDIINTLCSHYDVTAPIIIDNRESVNNIIDIDSQIINLVVSKDKELTMEESELEELVS